MIRPPRLPLLFLLTGMLLGLGGCPEEKIPEKKTGTVPSITIERFQLTETKQGRRLWVLDAVTANVFSNLIQVDTVTIHFYNEQPTAYSVLNARQGTLNTTTRNIIVRDHVTMVTDDSSRLSTDSLFWWNDSQRIITDSYVRIIKPDSTLIEGNGLKTTPDLKKIEIIGTVKGASPIQFPKIR